MDSKRQGRWRRLQQTLLVFAVATLAALALTSFTYFSDQRSADWCFLGVLRYDLMAFWLWASLVPVVGWVAQRFPLDGPRRWRNAAAHLLAAVGLVLAVVGVYVTVAFHVGHLYPEATWSEAFRHSWVRYFQFDLAVYAFILLGWYAVEWYRRLRDRELRAAQLETRLQEAKLAALRSQLNPHFLFNALNSVSALMHRDVDAADTMLARIGELLRLTLASDGSHEVRLLEELELLDCYFDVERIRFAERLAVTVDVTPSTLAAHLPPFSLQPLVENAIRHGVASRARGGRVTITARQVNDRLQLRVIDDGPGLRTSRPLREGVGLRNTRDRLRQLYGDAQQLAFLRPESGGLEVLVEVPWRTR